jgi:hypothetical protein
MTDMQTTGIYDTAEIEFVITDKDGNIKEQGTEVVPLGDNSR